MNFRAEKSRILRRLIHQARVSSRKIDCALIIILGAGEKRNKSALDVLFESPPFTLSHFHQLALGERRRFVKKRCFCGHKHRPVQSNSPAGSAPQQQFAGVLSRPLLAAFQRCLSHLREMRAAFVFFLKNCAPHIPKKRLRPCPPRFRPAVRKVYKRATATQIGGNG